MKNDKLDHLVSNGVIKGYNYDNFDEDGNLGKGKYRNTQRLVLEFANGDKLKVDTYCSGSLENTELMFS